MTRKLIGFHDEDRRALDELAEDRATSFQELMDEAVRDLLKKYKRPTGLREALRDSTDGGKVVPLTPRRSSASTKRPATPLRPR